MQTEDSHSAHWWEEPEIYWLLKAFKAHLQRSPVVHYILFRITAGLTPAVALYYEAHNAHPTGQTKPSGAMGKSEYSFKLGL